MNKSVRPFLFTISNVIYFSKSSKWELGFVHYVAKFITLRFELQATFLKKDRGRWKIPMNKDRTTFGIARIRTESSASMKMFEKKLWSQYWTRANSQSNMEFVIAPAIASIFEVKSGNSSSIRLLKCLSVKVNKNRKQKKYNDMDCYHQCY